MAKTKLTYELIETMAELKGKGLSNKDVCAIVGRFGTDLLSVAEETEFEAASFVM